MPLRAGPGGADNSRGVRVGSFFKWVKSNWIETLILSPKEKKRVSGTVLAMAVGTVFAFSEVKCLSLSLQALFTTWGASCISSSWPHLVTERCVSHDREVVLENW